MSKDTVDVSLPILPTGEIGGFHQGVASTEFDGHKVELSCGYGVGHTHFYVSVDGKRVLTVDTTPMLEALTEAALDIAEEGEV